jgi:hypothetical protein
LLKREGSRLARLAEEQAALQALAGDYAEDEPAFAAQLRDFIVQKAARPTTIASDATKVADEYL